MSFQKMESSNTLKGGNPIDHLRPFSCGTIISVNECEVQFTNTKFVVFEWEQGKLKLKAMASDKSFVDFVVDQIENAGQITYKKMFGEYAVYCNGKVVALVCDNQLCSPFFFFFILKDQFFVGNN